MKTSNLDILERSQVPPAQARAILRVMESELAARDTALATKADLFATKAELRDEMHALGLKLEPLRAELKRDIKGRVLWNFAFWAAQLAAIAGVLRLLK